MCSDLIGEVDSENDRFKGKFDSRITSEISIAQRRSKKWSCLSKHWLNFHAARELLWDWCSDPCDFRRINLWYT